MPAGHGPPWPPLPVIDATGEGDWPLPPGEYDAHNLLDDGYTSLAVAPFTVMP